MTQTFKNTIIDFVKKRKNFEELDLSVETHEDTNFADVIILTVDLEKIDKNNPNYDEEYKNIVIPKKERSTETGLILNIGPQGFYKDILKDIELFIGVKLQGVYDFKNYEYLDEEFQHIIKKAIKKSEVPTIKFNFEYKYDSPLPRAYFSKVPYSLENNELFNQYIRNLEKILNNNIDFNQYLLVRSFG